MRSPIPAGVVTVLPLVVALIQPAFGAAPAPAPAGAVTCGLGPGAGTLAASLSREGGRTFLVTRHCRDDACEAEVRTPLLVPDEIASLPGTAGPSLACTRRALAVTLAWGTRRVTSASVALVPAGGGLAIAAVSSDTTDVEDAGRARGGSSLDFAGRSARLVAPGAHRTVRRGPLVRVGDVPAGAPDPASDPARWRDGFVRLPSGGRVKALLQGDRLFLGFEAAADGRFRTAGPNPPLSLDEAGRLVPFRCAGARGCLSVPLAGPLPADGVTRRPLPGGRGVVLEVAAVRVLGAAGPGAPLRIAAFEVARAPGARGRDEGFATDGRGWAGVLVRAGGDPLPAFDGTLPWLPGGW